MTSHPKEPKLPESLEAIRAALAAGPTRGYWQVGGSFNEWAISSDYTVHGNPCASGRQFVACCFRVSKKDTPAYAQLFEATARFIAACNPEAITTLLGALKARDAEIERLRGALERSQRAHVIAGAERDQSNDDADRYRLLRRGQKWSVIDGIGNTLRADELDAAIDAHRKDEA